jgi:hypothetical protein
LIRARVQHHPSRANLLPALLESLAPLPTEVVEHSSDPPSPWAGYRKCLEDPPKCSHLLIVQDDAVLAENFAPAVKQIAKAQPDTPVCLFLGALPRDVMKRAQQAQRANVRYVPLPQRSFLPIVAVLWPRAKAVEFLEWATEHPVLPGQREPRSDDAMGGMWKMRTRQHIVVAVPSIVEHPDVEESTIGKRTQWGGKPRTAALFTPDATRYDWAAA